MREQRTKAQVKKTTTKKQKNKQKQKLQDNTHPLPPFPHPVIN